MPTNAPPGERSREGSRLAEPAVRERLRELPPSAKLVARILDDEAPLAQREIAERSLLPSRTVRYALTRLEEAALVEAHEQDARERRYAFTR